MREFLQAQGFDIWQSVLDGYTTPKGRPKVVVEKKLQNDNAMSLNIILRGLSESEKKINQDGKNSSAKELWYKLQENYTKKTMQECVEDQKEDTPKKEATSNKMDDNSNKHIVDESNEEKVKEVESSKYSCG